MRKILLGIAFLAITCVASATTQVSLKFGNVEVDCESNSIYADIMVRGHNNESFDLGGLSLRFQFNREALVYEGIETEYLSGEHDWYDKVEHAASYGFTDMMGVNSIPNNGDWVPVAKLKFTAVDFGQSTDFSWNRSDDYPSTLVTAFENQSNFALLDIQNYQILDEALSSLCQQSIDADVVLDESSQFDELAPKSYRVCMDEVVDVQSNIVSNNPDLIYSWHRSTDVSTVNNLNAANPSLSGWSLPGTYFYELKVSDPYFPENELVQSIEVVVVDQEACKEQSTGIAGLDANSDYLQVQPNPSNGDFDLEMLMAYQGKVDIHVLDAQGQNIIYTRTVELNSGGSKVVQFDLQQRLASGTYIIRALTDDRVYAKKLIVVK